MSAASANKLELLQIAESVAQEKMIDQEIVVKAMEEAWAKAAKYQYGPEFDIRAKIDRRTGDLMLARIRTVSENPENPALEIDVSEAQEKSPEAKAGDEISEDLPPLELGRIAAQNAKQVMLQTVRDAERERQYEEFKDRKGTIVNGIVRREEYGNIVLDIGRGEAVLRREQKIGRENYQRDDRLRAYITDVRRELRGPQIFLSRTATEFMVELFRMEVPEIYEDTIEIKAVARDPGSRAKIAVISHDSSIDPVGACVGMRGSRVQAVVNELQGERIDIIPWTENSVELIVSALQPAKVTTVILDDEGLPSEVVVPEDQLSLAIGRRGQNVRLACQLTGLDISILTEAQEMERRQADIAERLPLIMEVIDVDQVFAHLLVSEGFDSIEYLAACKAEELIEIEGIDLSIAEEVQSRAQKHMEKENRKSLEKARELGVESSLLEFEGLSPKMIETLAEEGILTLEEFATCADWELAGGYVTVDGRRKKDVGILENCDISLEEARLLVMSARVAAGIIDTSELEAAIAENEESGLEAREA